MYTPFQIKEILFKILVDKLIVEEKELLPEIKLEDLGCDDLDFVEIIMDIEREINNSILDDEIFDSRNQPIIKTVDELYQLIINKTNTEPLKLENVLKKEIPIVKVEIAEPIIGYKGFNSNLTCKEFKFEIGKTYETEFFKSNPNDKPTLCTNQGFHYCNDLIKVFSHYPKSLNHRYCKVEILGPFTHDHEKGITGKIKILEEITDSVHNNIIEKNLNLNYVKAIQEKHNVSIIGGSVALFLYGIKLQRFFGTNKNSDIDLISPYFIDPVIKNYVDLNIKSKSPEEKDVNEEVSGTTKERVNNDFGHLFTTTLNNKQVKIDLRIDPNQSYNTITYKGFDYKVCKLEHILIAKLNYSLNGQKKHKDDMEEIISIQQNLHEI